MCGALCVAALAEHYIQHQSFERLFLAQAHSQLTVSSFFCSSCSRIGETSPLPAAVVCRSFAQHATTMFFPHFVGDA
jgi:hypothetical protein